MGGCLSRSIDSEAMAVEINTSSAEERSAGNELAQNNAGQVPAEGGSSEYVGAFMCDDRAQQNAVEPTSLDKNNQTVEPMPRVSLDVQQNRSELTADVVENMAKASVDQPLNQIIGVQPMAEQAVHNQVIEERPVTLPVPSTQTQKTLPVSSAVQYDYQNAKESVFDVPVETTVKTILDEPAYQTLEENSIIERTLQDQIIVEQPVIRQTVPNKIYEEHPIHPLSPGDHAVLSGHPYATQVSAEVKDKVQVVETQQAGHDPGVVFEGRTYRTRVFDPNLNEYVYVGGNDLQPRGGLVM